MSSSVSRSAQAFRPLRCSSNPGASITPSRVTKSVTISRPMSRHFRLRRPPHSMAPHREVPMAEVLLFHHAQGLTPRVVAFADELRAGGHTVHTPDLFDGRTFGSIDEGMAFI